MPLIRSISGIRATEGDSLLPEMVAGYSAAFSNFVGSGSIVVGRDGRPSGDWVEQEVCKAIVATGNNAIKIGVVPTPTVQLLTEKLNAVGGISISASHNPQHWNGLKFLKSDGTFLIETEIQQVFDIYDNKLQKYSLTAGSVEENDSAINDHINSLLNINFFRNSDIINDISKKKFKVVVDAVNASGSLIVPNLLENLGCEVVKLYCDGTGNFPHTPEPLPENLTTLAKAVSEHNASFGVAVDPDADRLVLIDENGEPIGEEKTIALCSWAVLKNSSYFAKFSKVVCVNQSTSMATDLIAAEFNAEVFRSPVGEINVVQLMKEKNAIIGGEGSGGIILPESHYGRDSLVGITLILVLLTQENEKLSHLANAIPKLYMTKSKMEFSGDFSIIKAKTIEQYKDFSFTDNDGVRVDFGDSWVQVRASNTEPIIRVIAESQSNERTNELIEEIYKIIRLNS